MIRQPLTTITINNDPTANTLKPGTKELIKGFKKDNLDELGRIERGLTTKTPSEIRKSSAIGMRAMKKMRGSAKQRQIVKIPPHMTDLYNDAGEFIK